MNEVTEPIEHQSVFPEGHQEWLLGSTCDECKELYAKRRAQHGIAPYINLSRMRDYDYHSVSHLEKQAVAAARANGIEPERAP